VCVCVRTVFLFRLTVDDCTIVNMDSYFLIILLTVTDVVNLMLLQ